MSLRVDSAAARLVGRILAIEDRLLQSVDVTSVVNPFSEAIPVDGGNHFAIVVDPLAATGVPASQIVKLIIAGRPTPMPRNQCRVAAAPEAESVGHATSLAHHSAVLDLARVVIGIAPVLVTVLRDDVVVRDRVGLRTPDIDVGTIRSGIAGGGVLGRVSADSRGFDRCVDSVHQIPFAQRPLRRRDSRQIPAIPFAFAHCERLERGRHALVELRRRHLADLPMRTLLTTRCRFAIHSPDYRISRDRDGAVQTGSLHPIQFFGIRKIDGLAVVATQVQRGNLVQAVISPWPGTRCPPPSAQTSRVCRSTVSDSARSNKPSSRRPSGKDSASSCAPLPSVLMARLSRTMPSATVTHRNHPIESPTEAGRATSTVSLFPTRVWLQQPRKRGAPPRVGTLNTPHRSAASEPP